MLTTVVHRLEFQLTAIIEYGRLALHCVPLKSRVLVCFRFFDMFFHGDG